MLISISIKDFFYMPLNCFGQSLKMFFKKKAEKQIIPWQVFKIDQNTEILVSQLTISFQQMFTMAFSKLIDNTK